MAVSDLTVNEITSILEGLIENPYMFYVIVDSDGIISSINIYDSHYRRKRYRQGTLCPGHS